MGGRTLSRRKLAEYVAGSLDSGNGDIAVKQAAAYLVDSKQTHSVELLVRDVEELLAKRGTVVADVTSARTLTADEKTAIAEKLGAKQLHLRETIDKSVLGGVKIEVSGKRLDATLKHRIDVLKEMTLRKGTA